MTRGQALCHSRIYGDRYLTGARKDNPEAVRCEYTLSDDEIKVIEDYFAPGILKSSTFGLTTRYDGGSTVDGFDEDFDVFKTWLIKSYGDDDIKVALEGCDDFTSVYKVAGENKEDTDWTKMNAELDKLKTATEWTNAVSGFIFTKYVSPAIPKFWYFSDYYNLPARINISQYEKWLNSNRSTFDSNAEGFGIVAALFELSGLTVKNLKDEANYPSY